MNPTQARQLIKDTFTQAFEKVKFRTFAVNLLNHVDEEKKGAMAVPDAFAAHVKSCQRLATYADPQGELLDVLIVHLTEDYKIERTRTALRDFVAHKLKRGDNYKEAALVAFVPPDTGRWRLSYVRMQYESVRDPKTGVIKPEERPTPARRFSYLVGEGESCHTAQTRFLDLLQDTSTDPALAQIEEAFSVEAVTKEFFAKYTEMFGDINAAMEKLVAKDKTLRYEFNAKGVNTADFAKKLMGQIVFLYFLQKKGWLGVEKGKDWGAGPRNFFRRLADQTIENRQCLFNDVLEPLFYDTLATDRGHEAWCKNFKCRIPFLNGGLFEPLGDYDWKKTDIILPNKLFINDEPVEEGIIGTGVLDVFDRYNFTVNEAEPLEKEVAIDPEMLGKVFENLIEENRRKGLGAFYTPREIVHYMCQESLINYLDTAVNSRAETIGREKRKQAEFGDQKAEQTLLTAAVRKELIPRADIETFIRLGEQISHYEAVKTQYAIKMPKSIWNNAKTLDDALGAITVCDPAVGSGAFLVGMMTEIVRARMALNPYLKDEGDTDIPVCGIPDSQPPISITRRNLPHWTRDGAIYWITFRLADSLPQEELVALKAKRDVWIQHHPKPWSEVDWKEYDECFGKRIEEWLDAGHGTCALSRLEIRKIARDCILRFNDERFALHGGVIMPNHVHLLLEPLAGYSLSNLLKGIKGTSARLINQALKSTGTFWMDESYDHIVRSESQYHHFVRYIAENPAKAGLLPGKYWLYHIEGDTGIPACADGDDDDTGIPACASDGPVPQTGMSVSPSLRTPYHFKRHAIQNCLYGVDIDSSAVEIAKLRLWLSLVVDEEDVKQVKPLPNLDYKIVAGNSLLGVEKTLFNEKLFQQLEKLKPLYFDESDSTKKASLRRQIDDLIHELTNGKETFDFEIYFSEVFHKKRGFDLVVGNPPYLNFKSYSSGDRELYKQLYQEIFDGKADLLYYFVFKGMTLANAQGHLSFITSRYWLEAEFAAKLRTYVSGHYGIREILDFSNAVIFDQGIKVAISTLAKTKDSRDNFRFLSYIGKKFEGLGADKLEVCFVQQSKLLSTDNRWIFVGAEGSSLLSKITKDSVPLDDIAFCKQGIVTGRDRAFVFEAKSPISELPNSVIKPWIKVGDVHRYAIQPVKKRFLVYANDLDKISDYPKFHDGLKKHSEKLKNRREVKNGRIRWFDLQWPREKRFFDNEKLICRFKAERNTFALDTDGLYCSADITLVILKDEFRGKFKTKFILGLLNSQLLDYHFKSYAKLMDYRYEYYPKPVSLLRIKHATETEQKQVVALVDKILAAKQRDPEAGTTEWEREIDQIVYRLFDLTPDEIAHIEKSVTKTPDSGSQIRGQTKR